MLAYTHTTYYMLVYNVDNNCSLSYFTMHRYGISLYYILIPTRSLRHVLTLHSKQFDSYVYEDNLFFTCSTQSIQLKYSKNILKIESTYRVLSDSSGDVMFCLNGKNVLMG